MNHYSHQTERYKEAICRGLSLDDSNYVLYYALPMLIYNIRHILKDVSII